MYLCFDMSVNNTKRFTITESCYWCLFFCLNSGRVGYSLEKWLMDNFVVRNCFNITRSTITDYVTSVRQETKPANAELLKLSQIILFCVAYVGIEFHEDSDIYLAKVASPTGQWASHELISLIVLFSLSSQHVFLWSICASAHIHIVKLYLKCKSKSNLKVRRAGRAVLWNEYFFLNNE